MCNPIRFTILRRGNLQGFRPGPACVLTLILGFVLSGNLAAQDKTTFDDHVKAVFKQRCASCHNPNKKSGDLDVTNFTNLMHGGSSGTVIEPGDADGSYLFNLVSQEDEPAMPPNGKIPQSEIDLIHKWILTGALENQGSKTPVKKSTNIAMTGNPLERPAIVAIFPRLPLRPIVHTQRSPVVSSIATSPWAPIAAVSGQRQVVLYNTQSLQLIGVLPFPEGSVNVLRFSRTGDVLLAAGGRHAANGITVLWDVATGQRITTLGDELDSVLAADISPDQTMVAAGGADRMIRIYSAETGEKIREIKKHTEWVTALEFSTDGVLLATGDRNGGLHIWESYTGREYLTLKGHTNSITAVSWRGDSNVLASGSQDTTIRLWEMDNGRQLKSFAAHDGGTKSIEFTRDGRILSGGTNKVAKLWDQSGKELKSFPSSPDIILSVSWCNETDRALAGDFTGDVMVCDADAQRLTSFSPNPPPLETRVAEAKALVAIKTAALSPLQIKLVEVDKQTAELQGDLKIATRELAEANTAIESLKSELASVNNKRTAEEQQLVAWQTQLAKANEAKPLLTEALRNMSAAATKIENDAELRKQVEVLTNKTTSLDAAIQKMQSDIDKLKPNVEQSASQVIAASKKMDDANSVVNGAQKRVAAISEKLRPLVERRNKTRSQVEEISQAVMAAKASVQQWQTEIEFIAQLNVLNSELDAAQQVVSDKMGLLSDATTKLKEAQDDTQTAQNLVNQARATAEEIRARIRKIQGIDR